VSLCAESTSVFASELLDVSLFRSKAVSGAVFVSFDVVAASGECHGQADNDKK
jgi:hypothetical protein